MAKHEPYELKQMQSMPLEAKIIMTKERIRAWYDSWTRFEIYDQKTGKTRFETIDTRDPFAEPETKDTEIIKSAEPGAVYVSFSGGKDSTVLKHIVDSMYDDVPSLFVNTGLEYPEIQKFAMSQKNVIAVRPKMRFDEVIKKYGYPVIGKRVAEYVETAKRNPNSMRAKWIRGEEHTKFVAGGKYAYLVDADFPISGSCCAVMKKRPANEFAKSTGRYPMTGQMACESLGRENTWRHYGCNGFDMQHPVSSPLAFWTEQDILHYLKKYNVPYCSVYGDIVAVDDQGYEMDISAELMGTMCGLGEEVKLKTTGCQRTGCIFCMFGCHLEKEPNRFQRLKETHPRQYEYCIGGGEFVDGKWQPNKEGLGLGHVLDYLNVKY